MTPAATDPPRTRAEQEIDAQPGIGRKPFGFGWWALAMRSSAANINLLAKAQNWVFHLPLGPGFQGVDTRYSVAAYGSFGGGFLQWIVRLGGWGEPG
jgi:hypothetical protein